MKIHTPFWLILVIKLVMILRGFVLAFRPVSFSTLVVSKAADPPLTSIIHGSNGAFPGRAGLTKLFISTDASSRTLAPGSHVSELEVKKSRFLGYAKHVENWAEATSYIDQVKAEHPKARHWCYGLQCGVNPVTERCSDDGEPTGTAGLPILGAIKGEELSDVVCVVVRYFGGIKLGAGGLIRAYGAAARQVLREAPVEILIPKFTVRVSVTPENVGAMYDTVARTGGSTSGEEYDSDGSLSVTITCNLEGADRLRIGLTDSTRGTVKFLDE